MSRAISRILQVLLTGLTVCAAVLPAAAQSASLTGPVPVAQQPASTTPVYVRAGKLLDVRSGKMLDDQIIVISGGRIDRVAPAAQQQVPPGSHVVDLSHATVLPGLVDCHTHIMLADTDNSHYEEYLLKDSYQYRTILATLNVKRDLEAGFTAMRDVETEGAMYSDVDAVAETDYTGWYDSPQASPGQQVAMMRARLASMRRTFPGKVLVISEFGAEANTLNHPGAPGSYGYQSALLARHIAVYAADQELSGMLIWDLRDYPLIPAFQGGSIHFRLPHLRLIEGLIQKGLFTYGGHPKTAAGTVAHLYKGLPRG